MAKTDPQAINAINEMKAVIIAGGRPAENQWPLAFNNRDEYWAWAAPLVKVAQDKTAASTSTKAEEDRIAAYNQQVADARERLRLNDIAKKAEADRIAAIPPPVQTGSTTKDDITRLVLSGQNPTQDQMTEVFGGGGFDAFFKYADEVAFYRAAQDKGVDVEASKAQMASDIAQGALPTEEAWRDVYPDRDKFWEWAQPLVAQRDQAAADAQPAQPPRSTGPRFVGDTNYDSGGVPPELATPPPPVAPPPVVDTGIDASATGITGDDLLDDAPATEPPVEEPPPFSGEQPDPNIPSVAEDDGTGVSQETVDLPVEEVIDPSIAPVEEPPEITQVNPLTDAIDVINGLGPLSVDTANNWRSAIAIAEAAGWAPTEAELDGLFPEIDGFEGIIGEIYSKFGYDPPVIDLFSDDTPDTPDTSDTPDTDGINLLPDDTESSTTAGGEAVTIITGGGSFEDAVATFQANGGNVTPSIASMFSYLEGVMGDGVDADEMASIRQTAENALEGIINEIGYDPEEERDLLRSQAEQDIFEARKALGRKFLVSGVDDSGDEQRKFEQLELGHLTNLRTIDLSISNKIQDANVQNMNSMTAALNAIGQLQSTEAGLSQEQNQFLAKFGLELYSALETSRQFDTNTGLKQTELNSYIDQMSAQVDSIRAGISQDWAKVTGFTGQAGEIGLEDLGFLTIPEPEDEGDVRVTAEAVLGRPITDMELRALMEGDSFSADSMPTNERFQFAAQLTQQALQTAREMDMNESQVAAVINQINASILNDTSKTQADISQAWASIMGKTGESGTVDADTLGLRYEIDKYNDLNPNSAEAMSIADGIRRVLQSSTGTKIQDYQLNDFIAGGSLEVDNMATSAATQFNTSMLQRVYEFEKNGLITEAESAAAIKQINTNIVNSTRQLTSSIAQNWSAITGQVGGDMGTGEISTESLGLTSLITSAKNNPGKMSMILGGNPLSTDEGQMIKDGLEAWTGREVTNAEVVKFFEDGTLAVDSMPTLESRRLAITDYQTKAVVSQINQEITNSVTKLGLDTNQSAAMINQINQDIQASIDQMDISTMESGAAVRQINASIAQSWASITGQTGGGEVSLDDLGLTDAIEAAKVDPDQLTRFNILEQPLTTEAGRAAKDSLEAFIGREVSQGELIEFINTGNLSVDAMFTLESMKLDIARNESTAVISQIDQNVLNSITQLDLETSQSDALVSQINQDVANSLITVTADSVQTEAITKQINRDVTNSVIAMGLETYQSNALTKQITQDITNSIEASRIATEQSDATIDQVNQDIENSVRGLTADISQSWAQITGETGGMGPGVATMDDLGLADIIQAAKDDPINGMFMFNDPMSTDEGQMAKQGLEAWIGREVTEDELRTFIDTGSLEVDSMPTIEARQMAIALTQNNMDRVYQNDQIANQLGLDRDLFNEGIRQADRQWNMATLDVASNFEGMDSERFTLAKSDYDRAKKLNATLDNPISEVNLARQTGYKWGISGGDFLAASNLFDQQWGAQRDALAQGLNMDAAKFDLAYGQAQDVEDRSSQVWEGIFSGSPIEPQQITATDLETGVWRGISTAVGELDRLAPEVLVPSNYQGEIENAPPEVYEPAFDNVEELLLNGTQEQKDQFTRVSDLFRSANGPMSDGNIWDAMSSLREFEAGNRETSGTLTYDLLNTGVRYDDTAPGPPIEIPTTTVEWSNGNIQTVDTDRIDSLTGFYLFAKDPAWLLKMDGTDKEALFSFLNGQAFTAQPDSPGFLEMIVGGLFGVAGQYAGRRVG